MSKKTDMQKAPRKHASRELRLLGVNGVVWQFTQHEFFRLYTTRVFLIPAALFLTLVMVFEPAAFEAGLGFWHRLAFWLLVFPSYLLLFQLLATLLTVLNNRLGRTGPIPSLAIHGVIVPPYIFGIVAMAGLLTGLPDLPAQIGWSDIARGYLFAILFEALFIFQLLPQSGYRDTVDLPGAETAGDVTEPGTGPRFVRLGGRQIRIADIRHAKSAEHYLEISTTDGMLMERMRMSDFVEQLPVTAGIRTHRSHWVARRAARRLQSRGKRKVLILDDGSEIPVARSRLGEVETWLAEST